MEKACRHLALVCHGGYDATTEKIVIPPLLKIFQYVEWNEVLYPNTILFIQDWLIKQNKNKYCEIYQKYAKRTYEEHYDFPRHYLFIVFESKAVGYIHINTFMPGQAMMNTKLGFLPPVEGFPFGLYQLVIQTHDSWHQLQDYSNRGNEMDHLSSEINKISAEQNNPQSVVYQEPLFFHQFTCQSFDSSIQPLQEVSQFMREESVSNIALQQFLNQYQIFNIIKFNEIFNTEQLFGKPVFMTDTIVELIEHLFPTSVAMDVEILGGKVMAKTERIFDLRGTEPKIMKSNEKKNKDQRVEKRVQDLMITDKIMTSFDAKNKTSIQKNINPGKEKDPKQIDMKKLLKKYVVLTGQRLPIEKILPSLKKTTKKKTTQKKNTGVKKSSVKKSRRKSKSKPKE